MIPEPDPAPRAPATSILTTDGSTFAATCSTEPAGASESGVSTTCDVVRVPGLPALEDPSSSSALQAAAPPTPAAPPATSAVAMTAAARPARRGRRWTGSGAVIVVAWVGGPSGGGPCGAGKEENGFCGPGGGLVGWSFMSPPCEGCL